MSNTNLEYTLKELQQKLKKQKTILIIQCFLVLLMLIFSVISTLDKGFSFQTFLPLFFAPMIVVMYMEMKKIKKQIAQKNG
jgi:uncharacterized integral membrane protein